LKSFRLIEVKLFRSKNHAIFQELLNFNIILNYSNFLLRDSKNN
jgi:hypothetical protein